MPINAPFPASILETILETWHGFLDLVYPPKCLACGRLGPLVLCEDCRSSFALLGPPLCDRCGVPVPARDDREPVRLLCLDCRQRTRFHFRAVRAAGEFDGTLRLAILRFKYGPKPPLSEPLGETLAAMLREKPFGKVKIDLVVPVPLHPSRLRERGFNQSALLAAHAAEAVHAPIVEDCLVRIRRTRPQAELRLEERSANVKNAFAVLDPSVFADKRVLLVDDVVTSMHTVDECARVLADAGAKGVYVAAVARGV